MLKDAVTLVGRGPGGRDSAATAPVALGLPLAQLTASQGQSAA